MDASPNLVAFRRAAVIACVDAAATPGKLKIYAAPRPSPGGTPSAGALVTIIHADPCGTVDASGIALTDTDFCQVTTSGTAAWARHEDGDGNWVADYKAGLASDPTAEVTLDTVELFAGAFVGLVGARINGGD